MKELVRITNLERAQRLLHPLRLQLLRRLAEPRTCAELATELDFSQQRVNHHLKELLRAGLIRIHHTRRVRNLLEATYIATAKAYWISPRLLRDESIPPEVLRDQLSLSNLLVLAETVQEEVGDLLERAEDQEVPSFGLQLDITLLDADARQQFAQDLLDALQPVVERYEAKGPANRYRTTIMCYPTGGASQEES